MRLVERQFSFTIANGRCLLHFRKEQKRCLGAVPIEKELCLVPVVVPKSTSDKLWAINEKVGPWSDDKTICTETDHQMVSSLWCERIGHANLKIFELTINQEQ